MDEPLHCLVEIPKGSRNKYEWDDALGGIKLDRFLFSSVVYPTDYGFVTDTLGEDGDPLDAMVCVSEPTFSGCLIPVTAIAVFRMTDDKGQDDKILCVPHEDPNWSGLRELDDLPAPAAHRDRALLLDLQAARGQGGRRRRLVRARRGACGSSRRAARAGGRSAPDARRRPAGRCGGVRAPRRLVRRRTRTASVDGPDPELPVFARSAVKPLQALGSVRAGVLERFGLGERHLALACASHGGVGAHVEVVARCSRPAGWSRARSAAGRSCRSTRAPPAACGRRGSATTARASTRSGSPAASPRTGRSTATSAAGTGCRARCATASSRRAASPAPSEEATDGCGMRTFAVPLAALAGAFARLASGGLGAGRRPLRGGDARAPRAGRLRRRDRHGADARRGRPGGEDRRRGRARDRPGRRPRRSRSRSATAPCARSRPRASRWPAPSSAWRRGARDAGAAPILNSRGLRVGELRALGD